jgi:release factor glutamine methyltransferase
VTWRSLLGSAEAALARGAEARWVIERAAGLEGAGLVAVLDELAPPQAAGWCEDMLRRRGLGEPLQYVLGRWGFRGLELLVDRRVLIPRPETEVVVEVARAELAALRGSRLAAPVGGDRSAGAAGPVGRAGGPVAALGVPGGPVVVDLGTGSGAIALSLAVEEPGVSVWATDVSADALAVARANLAGIGGRAAARVRLVQGDWYGALPVELQGKVELIVSNPPYVAEHEEAALPVEVSGWEPRPALVAGPSGLESIRAVVAGAPGWLGRPGVLVVEIAPHQAGDALRVARAAGFGEPRVLPDLAGRPRVLVARMCRTSVGCGQGSSWADER